MRLRRFKPRFGLKALIVLITVVAAAAAYPAWWLRQIPRERAAIDALQSVGADIQTWASIDDLLEYDKDAQVPPAWMRAVFVPNDYQSLERIDHLPRTTTSDDLACLQACPNLNTAILDSPRLDDGVFQHLRSCTLLRKLYLHNGTQITGSGFAHLSHLKRLEYLSVSHCALQLDFLDGLTDLPQLRILSLTNSSVTDRAIEKLKHCTALAILNVSQNPISDIGLGYIAECSGLVELVIDDTDVTDDGLLQLAALKELRFLSLEANSGIRVNPPRRFTAQGIRTLRAQLPQLQVSF